MHSLYGIGALFVLRPSRGDRRLVDAYTQKSPGLALRGLAGRGPSRGGPLGPHRPGRGDGEPLGVYAAEAGHLGACSGPAIGTVGALPVGLDEVPDKALGLLFDLGGGERGGSGGVDCGHDSTYAGADLFFPGPKETIVKVAVSSCLVPPSPAAVDLKPPPGESNWTLVKTDTFLVDGTLQVVAIWSAPSGPDEIETTARAPHQVE